MRGISSLRGITASILWAQQDRRIAALDRVSIRDIALSSACALAVSKFMLVRIGQSAVVRFLYYPASRLRAWPEAVSEENAPSKMHRIDTYR
jgi:hypothetical protein